MNRNKNLNLTYLPSFHSRSTPIRTVMLKYLNQYIGRSFTCYKFITQKNPCLCTAYIILPTLHYNNLRFTSTLLAASLVGFLLPFSPWYSSLKIINLKKIADVILSFDKIPEFKRNIISRGLACSLKSFTSDLFFEEKEIYVSLELYKQHKPTIPFYWVELIVFWGQEKWFLAKVHKYTHGKWKRRTFYWSFSCI